MEFPRIIDRRKLAHDEPEILQQSGHSHGAVNAMGIEDHLRTPDRNAKIKRAARRHHASQFSYRLAGARRILGITVAPETDMLGHMQAGE